MLMAGITFMHCAPGQGIGGGGSCSLVGLRWWASISYAYACLRGFPALVSDCLCMPNQHVSDTCIVRTIKISLNTAMTTCILSKYKHSTQGTLNNGIRSWSCSGVATIAKGASHMLFSKPVHCSDVGARNSTISSRLAHKH